ncbi:helix-turn-helix domain-containing protein [Bacillus ginsengihumi]|uniref:Helix-turn-helix domain-containing protein n=1 Tax=Heyndrickxia ginsengihumi TaxID=363870 RepID=A0A6M0PAC5_9BACI|nr:helix-turn-helix domain-containing protein [Heyndrickxia ginsengihumi]NEY21732.1 helix-turn-helix domain-containing protein [Heyndrickxia ginsengihumi]
MRKKAITLIASEETYKNLSTFETIDQLNETVRTYKEMLSTELNKTCVAVLDLLHRYSAKYTGVSFLRKNQIGELIGKSRRTIIRACKKLEELGIIRQYEMKRNSDMQQTSNAIVIQPLEEVFGSNHQNVTQEEIENPIVSSSKKMEMSHQENNLYSLKQNIINKRYNGDETEFTSNRVPKKFKDLASNFYDSANTIEELWKVVKCATSKLDYTFSEITDMACDSFRQLVRQIKKNRIRKNIYACYWGIVNNILDQMFYEERYELEKELGVI